MFSAVDFTLSGSNIKNDYCFAPNLWNNNVDQSQIGQAIHNVVMNSSEVMPEGGVIKIVAGNIALSEKTDSLPAGNYVKISITDQGDGIPPDKFDKIFNPYYSTKNRGTRKGMGRGLSICHSIIMKHGGGVSVDSQIDVGTTFNLFLPAAGAGSAVQPEIKEPAQAEGISADGRILVMDDDERIRELAGEILEHLGYRVELAADGAEAVSAYRAALRSSDPFDAVILNLTVRGGMGGKEAI